MILNVIITPIILKYPNVIITYKPFYSQLLSYSAGKLKRS